MPYYIQNINQRGPYYLTRVVKRLRDFTGTEGEMYSVARRKERRVHDFVPIYKFEDGKLVKDSAHLVWLELSS
jgi:hypothetical protein